MEVSAPSSNLSSVKQAISMANMRNAVNQDAESVDTLLEGMAEQAEEIEEQMDANRGKHVHFRV